MKRLFRSLLVCSFALLGSQANAAIIIANADSEVRESDTNGNRSTSTELATRVAGNRNSAAFMQFDVTGITAAELANDISVRLTFRNNNVNTGRIVNSVNPSFMPTAAFNFSVANPTLYSSAWADSATTVPGIPGIIDDDDFNTSLLDSAAYTFVGQSALSTDMLALDGSGNPLNVPVGSDFLLTVATGSALHDAIIAAQTTSHGTITVAMEHAWTPADAAEVPGGWMNFNYLFNPLDQTTLNNDANSVFSGADNSAGQFAPSLITAVPEPGSLAILGLASAFVMRRRRR